MRSNALGIENYVCTDLFGSGCVEKAVDVLISRRFKLPGMSWLKPGAQGMVKLKVLRYNRTWNDQAARRGVVYEAPCPVLPSLALSRP